MNDLQKNNQTQFSNTRLNLNFDMLGSPNYIPMVFNGSTLVGSDKTKLGASNLQILFETFATTQFNVTLKGKAMSGGSDFYPFILAGIPANGHSFFFFFISFDLIFLILLISKI